MSEDMKIKEKDVTVILFQDKEVKFEHANVIYSAPNFLRFLTADGIYICYSGSFKTTKIK